MKNSIAKENGEHKIRQK